MRLLLLLALALPALAGDDPEKAFRKAMGAAQGDPGKQEAAVRALGGQGAAAAKLLAELATDPALDPKLRDAADETFEGQSGDALVKAWAATAIAPGKGREKQSAIRVLCVELLAGRLKEEPGLVDQLLPALGDESWSVQVAAIRGLVHAPRKEVVGALATLAGKAEGRVLAETKRALETLTGEKHPDGAAWASWWAAQGESWQPSGERAAPAEPLRTVERFKPESSIFEAVESTRVIFVVDVSGSMQVRADDGKKKLTRLEAVQNELVRVIGELPEGDKFNVIAFSDGVTPWKKKLTPASKANKDAAQKWVRGLRHDGETNISDSLEVAFQESEVDTIHFLSDGTPTRGKLTIGDEILAAVRRWNAGRRVRVCTVAFLAGDPTPFGVAENRGMSERFLKALAEQNEGTFKLFDE